MIHYKLTQSNYNIHCPWNIIGNAVSFNENTLFRRQASVWTWVVSEKIMMCISADARMNEFLSWDSSCDKQMVLTVVLIILVSCHLYIFFLKEQFLSSSCVREGSFNRVLLSVCGYVCMCDCLAYLGIFPACWCAVISRQKESSKEFSPWLV